MSNRETYQQKIAALRLPKIDLAKIAGLTAPKISEYLRGDKLPYGEAERIEKGVNAVERVQATLKASVYFVQAENSGRIKIGQSVDVTKRMSALRCGSPEPLKLLEKMSTEVAQERYLHSMFRAHRIAGEWFEPAEEILSYIKANATLDDDVLAARELEAETQRLAKEAETTKRRTPEKQYGLVGLGWSGFLASVIGTGDPVKLARLRELAFKNLRESALTKQQEGVQ